MRTVLFVFGTWGLILGVPVLSVILLWRHLGEGIAVAVGVVLLLLGIFVGEWLARLMNHLLDRNKEQT
ncbi:MAG: hypothetical protein ACKV2T_31415 [Kofleriaceae bacterium]